MTPELNRIYQGDAIAVMKTWPDAFIHCAITSPPYFGLRNYGVDGQIGLEDTPTEYVARLVEVFREVRRVLRDDGSLWLNLGDSYANARSGEKREMPHHDGRAVDVDLANGRAQVARGKRIPRKTGRWGGGNVTAVDGLKHKDLIGIPWMVALALRADGWYLRADIIWAKKNCMPESVTDRPSKSHEHIFMLAKSERYFYDAEAIKEPVTASSKARVAQNEERPNWNTDRKRDNPQGAQTMNIEKMIPASGLRNKRDVWNVATQPFRGAHYATFPPKLITPCVLAGTSACGVCATCGAPTTRIVEKGAPDRAHQRACGGDAEGAYAGKSQKDYASAGAQDASATKARILAGMVQKRTMGWTATCACAGGGRTPAIVLDPFMGAGTTALVAATHGRRFLGVELNPKNVKMGEDRVAGEAAQGKLL